MRRRPTAPASSLRKLLTLRELKRLADPRSFSRHLSAVRAAHKPKRNLMKLLDKKGLELSDADCGASGRWGE